MLNGCHFFLVSKGYLINGWLHDPKDMFNIGWCAANFILFGKNTNGDYDKSNESVFI